MNTLKILKYTLFIIACTDHKALNVLFILYFPVQLPGTVPIFYSWLVGNHFFSQIYFMNIASLARSNCLNVRELQFYVIWKIYTFTYTCYVHMCVCSTITNYWSFSVYIHFWFPVTCMFFFQPPMLHSTPGAVSSTCTDSSLMSDTYSRTPSSIEYPRFCTHHHFNPVYTGNPKH